MGSIYLVAPGGSQTVHEESDARELWSRGLIGPDWLYWLEGMAEWRPAAEFFGVFLPLAAMAVPPVALSMPEPAVPPVTSFNESPRGFVKDPTRLTRLLVVFLWVGVGMAVVSMILEGISMATGYTAAAVEAEGELTAFDLVMAFFALLHLPVFIVTGVSFLMWIYRANKNARGLGARDLDYTPGWSVGWYFVPVFNLWRPYQAMKQIWQASKNPGGWQAEEPPKLLGAWWGFWIIDNMMGNLSFRLALNADSPGPLMASSIVSLVSGVTGIVLCLLAIRMVRSIFGLQSGWAAQPRESRCALCDRPMTAQEMVVLNNVYVCPGCKPTVLQQIAEGASFR